MAPPLPDGRIRPDRPGFRELAARYRVVPVTRRLLADGETALGAYGKLAGGPGSFLLESARPDGTWSRYAWVGVRSVCSLTTRDGVAYWAGDPPDDAPQGTDPLEVLRETLLHWRAPPRRSGPPFLAGFVGWFGYDLARRLERLPGRSGEDTAFPEMCLQLATQTAIVDHRDGSVLLVSAAVVPAAAGNAAVDAAYDDAVARLDVMAADLAKSAEPSLARFSLAPGGVDAPVPASGFPGFRPAVREVVEQIRAGECFQVVLSQRYERPTTADAVDVYRALRAGNPSPYMFLLRGQEHDVVGSSPETFVSLERGRARMRPIAGTRRRGGTAAEDEALAQELRSDPKERAEHVMLVDLIRNDLGRVAEAGTVRVVRFGEVERFSHVMHLVSTVEAMVRPGQGPVEVLAATFPTGTLTGAPKPRAMELIELLEPGPRGLFGGAVGWVDLAGGMDTSVAIRTAVLSHGVARVHAGAGIVADSDPAREDAECEGKAMALLAALELAEGIVSER